MLRRVSIVAAALVLAACTSSAARPTPSSSPAYSQLNDQNGSSGQYQGIGVTPPQPRPSFTLDSMTGKPFSLSSTDGHPTFLYFGYTNCPDICPETMANIRLALTKQPKALQQRTYVIFVTTDVKHDTDAVLREWLGTFQRGIAAHVIGLRGTQAQIDAAQAAAHIPLAEDDGQTHSALVLLYGKDDYAHVEYPISNNQPDSMAHDLPLVAA